MQVGRNRSVFLKPFGGLDPGHSLPGAALRTGAVPPQLLQGLLRLLLPLPLVLLLSQQPAGLTLPADAVGKS